MVIKNSYFLHYYSCVSTVLISLLLSDFEMDSVHDFPKEIGQLIHINVSVDTLAIEPCWRVARRRK